ncbi:MAG: hypothetical protein HY940_07745 [Gammaproteobacteria bacterium]|nr:hypothetical protein [Gammaproteobacteria bacterium]
MPTSYQPGKLGPVTARSAVEYRPAPLHPQQLLTNLPISSRVLRSLAAALLLGLLAQKGSQLHLPHFLHFIILVIGFYAGITALTGWEPFHALNKDATTGKPY